MDDDTEVDPRTAAIRRIRDKRDLWTHLFIYVVVNTMLVIIWALSTGGYFWPMWSIMGWGIGLAARRMEHLRRRPGNHRGADPGRDRQDPPWVLIAPAPRRAGGNEAQGCWELTDSTSPVRYDE